jgi:hypothetical protein
VKIKIYKTIILPVVLYGCETWYLTVLRRIFGPKRDEGIGGSRKLHNEELHGLYFSPSIIRVIKAVRIRWAGHVTHMGEVRGAYNILVGRHERRRPLEDLGVHGRTTLRWILRK